MLSDKQIVHSRCLEWAEAKIDLAQNSLEQLNISLEIETKSSMGDKYETSRSLINQEKEKYYQQINQANQIRSLLINLDPNQKHDQIDMGSLVTSDSGKFYISAGIGKLIIENQGTSEIMAISIQSPIGQLLKGRKQGEAINFNGKEIYISAVE